MGKPTPPPQFDAATATETAAPARLVGYVKASTLAELLDCSESTVQDYERRGLLPKRKYIGGLARWKWSEVEEMIEGKTFSGATQDPILQASRGR